MNNCGYCRPAGNTLLMHYHYHSELIITHLPKKPALTSRLAYRQPLAHAVQFDVVNTELWKLALLVPIKLVSAARRD